MAKVRIETGRSPLDTKIYIDDWLIPGCWRYCLSQDIDGPPELTLYIRPSHISEVVNLPEVNVISVLPPAPHQPG